MKLLQEKIQREGKAIGTKIVKVDGFVNHQIDVAFMEKIGKEFRRRFDDVSVDKILTVEASGIAIACIASPYFNYSPVVFGKKTIPSTLKEGFYQSEARSFTKGTQSTIVVSKEFLSKGDSVLIIDDFLAHGEAALALAHIVEEAGATVEGIGIVIEKAFQGGGQKLKDRGYRVESLAVIEKIQEGKVFFKNE